MLRRNVKPGDPIRSKIWNKLVDQVNKITVAGDRKISSSAFGSASRLGITSVETEPPTDYLVRVKLVDAGVPGSATEQCGLVYDMYRATGLVSDGTGGKEDGDTRLAIDVQPMYGRTTVGKYEFTISDVPTLTAHGRAFQGVDPDHPENGTVWRLALVYGELPVVTTCDVG